MEEHESDRMERGAPPRSRSDSDPAPTVPSERDAEEVAPKHERYAVRDLVGRGGQGFVYRALDRELDRDVALKTVRPTLVTPKLCESFVEEARTAARLTHPSIVPIHDAGLLEDGRPYYTMRLVSGRSLADVLRSLRAVGDEEASEGSWTLVRLVQALQQACRALQLAHEHGVLHRDVKPANIMTGRFGEILLVDWGLAKSSGVGATDSVSASDTVKGTISYMSPEQACGNALDARADVYSVGVVLYELLTLQLPHEGSSPAETIAAILRDVPQPPERVAPERAIPPELSELAMRLLAKEPAERVQAAGDVADELQAFLEGVRDRERREAAAEEARVQAEECLQRHEQAVGEAQRLEAEVSRLEPTFSPWDPIATKRELIEARQSLDRARLEAEALELDAAERYTDVLAHVPDHAEARRALADFYWRRFLEAEESGDAVVAHGRRLRVERFHDGRYARELRGEGSLELRIEPGHAVVVLHELVEEDLVLVDGPGRELGRGDVRVDALAMGRYVVVASAEGREPARYPVRIGRGEKHEGVLRLLPAGSLPDGFVYVPGTEAVLGGDDQATNGWPRHRVRVESFAMARHPVTFGEYCEYLDELDPQEAKERVPRTEVEGPLCKREGANGRFVPLAGIPLTESFLKRHGSDAASRIPVFGVDDESAREHARWRSDRDGRTYRLPTAVEWELVASGCGATAFPWGDTFDAALCHGRDSWPGEPELAPVGSFSSDCSAHGACDLAGGMQEWTASWFDEGRGLCEVRGGSWFSGPTTARAKWRGASQPGVRAFMMGFRLALDLFDTARA